MKLLKMKTRLFLVVILFIATTLLIINKADSPITPQVSDSSVAPALTSTPLPTRTPFRNINRLYFLTPERLTPIHGFANKLSGANGTVVGDKFYAVYSPNTILEFDLRTKTSSVFYKNRLEDYEIHNITFLEPYLYLTLVSTDRKHSSNYNDFYENRLVEMNTNAEIVRTVVEVDAPLFQSTVYLGKTDNNLDIIYIRGGDGCGGSGQIQVVRGGQTYAIAETGLGCIEKPRFYGIIDNQAILADFVRTGEGYTIPDYTEKLMLVNLDNRETSEIQLGAKMNASSADLYSVLDDRKLYFQGLDNYLHVYDFDTKTTTNLKLDVGEGFFFGIVNGKIFKADINSKLATIIDITNNSKHEFRFNYQINSSGKWEYNGGILIF